jgi:hypothetical protein
LYLGSFVVPIGFAADFARAGAIPVAVHREYDETVSGDRRTTPVKLNRSRLN